MIDKQLKILLLGGTGAIGSHLSEILSTQGHLIFITSRKNRVENLNIKYIKGNAQDFSFLSRLLAQNEYDVCVDFMSYATHEFSKRVELLLDSVGQYVYISSARVYSNSNDIITEDPPRLLDVIRDKDFLGTDEYSLAKARQENLLFKTNKTNWTIIRPYITYSENRLQLGVMEKEQWLYRALNGRKIVFSSDIGEHYTTLTYGKDVASGIAAICGQPRALSEVFNVTTSESVKWVDVLNEYVNICKKNDIDMSVNIYPRSMHLRYASIQYQIKYDRYFDRRFDNSKISQFVDTKNFISLKQGLSLCLDSFLTNPQFNNFDMRGEAIRDRLTHQCASRNEFSSIKNYYLYLALRYLCPQSIL